MQPTVGLTRKKPTIDEPHVDPVCKMLVLPETAAAKYEYDGTTYYFCAVGCKAKFAADPGKFTADLEESTAETQRRGDLDDGIGMTPGQDGEGHGLNNMRRRIKEQGGVLSHVRNDIGRFNEGGIAARRDRRC